MDRSDAINVVHLYLLNGGPEDIPSKDALIELVKAGLELERMQKGRPTNEEKIRQMNTAQFAQFLDDIANAYHLPWEGRFMDTFCNKCDAAGNTSGDPVCMCDVSKCPHGSEVAWWLQQPANMEEYIPYEEVQ